MYLNLLKRTDSYEDQEAIKAIESLSTPQGSNIITVCMRTNSSNRPNQNLMAIIEFKTNENQNH